MYIHINVYYVYMYTSIHEIPSQQKTLKKERESAVLKLTFASSVVLQDSVVLTTLFVCSVSRVDKIISYDTINLKDDNRSTTTVRRVIFFS